MPLDISQRRLGLDPALTKTLHRAKSRTVTQLAPVKQPPVTRQGQPILPTQITSGSRPLSEPTR
jgi:hypothetical protein